MSTTNDSKTTKRESHETNPTGAADELVAQLQKELYHNKRLLSILSHDLKNLFNQVLGGLEVLEGYCPHIGGGEDQASKLFKLTRSSAEEVNTTFKSMLLWAKSGSGQLPFRPEVLSLKGQFDKVIDQFQLAANLKKIIVRNTVEENVEVFGDRNMLNCILLNLVGNAIKFTIPGGTVTLGGRCFNDHSEIHVTDSGKGIRVKASEELLEVKALDATNEAQVGIGLIICRDFVRTHGGKMEIINDHAAGTRIVVALPHSSKEETR